MWEFIRANSLPHCKLYDEGWERLGCVGCPMGGTSCMEAELARWPSIRKVYVKAFDEMVAKRKKLGMRCIWNNGEEVMSWWLGKMKLSEIDGQVSMFDQQEEKCK